MIFPQSWKLCLRQPDRPGILCLTAASGKNFTRSTSSLGYEGASLCRDINAKGNPVSDGSIILLRALLRGMGRQAECDILVRKSVRNKPDAVYAAGSPAYSECSIISAPADLPDGEYRMEFEGHFVMETKERDAWHFPSVSLGDVPFSDDGSPSFSR